MARAGRKDKYAELVQPRLADIEEWISNGVLEKDIAKNLGVSESSYYLYKTQHLELSEAVKKGREKADEIVEGALFRNACGYTFVEETEERLDGVMAVTKRVAKNVMPNTTAQIFWLKNRKPSEWKDKQDIAIGQEKPFEIEIKVIK